MKDILSLIAAVVALTVAGTAAAAPCSAANVAGTWSLVSVRSAEPGVEEFYARAPYEWTRYTVNGDRVGMMYLASNRPKASSAEIESSLTRADEMDGVTYTVRWLRPPGRMLVLRDGQPFQAFECAILDSPVGDARAGDMLITQIEGTPMLRRVQRRVAP
ncbi:MULTISPECIES: hypothetical protein [unclassified Brevundimonas]|uniref:hypothetical protein n=1 Tax=unclassified Brevundimonas TaxID=2622653 RepID=UPI003B588C6B